MEDDGPMQALSYKGRFSRDAKNPVQADVVVVDESSMLDLPLAAALLAAVPPSAQVVFVGDADQLPSVGPGSLLRDLLAARNVPSIALTDIFRQAAASGIVRAAHAINSGAFLPLDIREQRYDADVNELRIVADAQDVDLPPIDPDLKPDCLWVSLPSETNASVEAVLDHVLCDILPARGFSPKDLQVLSPMRRGVASTGSLNSWLQTSLNPSCESKKEITVGGFSGDVTFREGDRVLQQRNDYDKEVFNGDLGVIQRIDAKAGTAIVSFGADFKEVSYTKGELRDLIPAYAMTIHKAQGSEYRAVVLVMTNAHKPLTPPRASIHGRDAREGASSHRRSPHGARRRHRHRRQGPSVHRPRRPTRRRAPTQGRGDARKGSAIIIQVCKPLFHARSSDFKKAVPFERVPKPDAQGNRPRASGTPSDERARRRRRPPKRTDASTRARGRVGPGADRSHALARAHAS